MSHREVFEALTRLEAELFYKKLQMNTEENIEAHAILHETVKAFAKSTGCQLT